MTQPKPDCYHIWIRTHRWRRIFECVLCTRKMKNGVMQ